MITAQIRFNVDRIQ